MYVVINLPVTNGVVGTQQSTHNKVIYATEVRSAMCTQYSFNS
jgi:hypothetical protein